MKIKSKSYDYGPIGHRIRRARQERGYTQEYVAERMNVSCQHISDIERGLNGMSIPALMDICRILDTSADYILFGTMQAEGKNPLAEIADKMTEEQRACAEEMLAAFAKACKIQK